MRPVCSGYAAAPWLMRLRRLAQWWRTARWVVVGMAIGAVLTSEPVVWAVAP